jgi:hypothetical protein
MSDNEAFLVRVIAARKAAWLVFLIAIGLQMFTYLGYLGLGQGRFDGLIEAGLYGDITRAELTRLTLHFVSALKLMNIAILMAALFLTLWVRGLRRGSN